MDKYTFGNSKAAVNLMTTLEKPKYQDRASTVTRLLSKQLTALKAIMSIPDKNTRETTLLLWKRMFIERIDFQSLPEVIKTHTLCVATGYYRKYMAISSVNENKKIIPIIDCPTCGAKDVPLSHEATMTKGEKTIEIWACSSCGKVPNVAEDLRIKRWISIKELKALGYEA